MAKDCIEAEKKGKVDHVRAQGVVEHTKTTRSEIPKPNHRFFKMNMKTSANKMNITYINYKKKKREGELKIQTFYLVVDVTFC